MSRSGKVAYDRLLSLLHAKTIPEVRLKIPAVKRILYAHEPDTESESSILDDMMHSRWGEKPMITAIDEVESSLKNSPKSNVLRLRCPVGQVGRADLHNIYPRGRERQFALPEAVKKGLEFHVVKGRNPITLLFAGYYYLVFPNYNHACVYYLESKGKLINGFDVDLEFVSLNSDHLKFMGSPLLHSTNVFEPVRNFESLSENFRRLQSSEIFKESANQLKIVAELEKVLGDRSAYTNMDTDPLYDILEYFMDIPSRYSLVVVRNLPFGITRPTLNHLLWNYEFATEKNPQKSMRILHSNTTAQITLALMHFKDEANARRFVRNYHGSHWNKMSKANLKPLYEPIRCEIVD